MAAACVNLYARDEDQLYAYLREATEVGPARERLIAAGHALFVGDPSEHVLELASSPHPVDRKGRVIVLRAPQSRRIASIAAVMTVMLLGGLTVGAQTVTAMGVGVARAPGNTRAVYLGVRVDDAELAGRNIVEQLHALGASLIVDARVAQRHRGLLEHLTDARVEIDNGGSGHSSLLRWTRARNDIVRAGQVITRYSGRPVTVFAPGRGFDAFDQYYAHRHKEKLILPYRQFGPDQIPKTFTSGKVYLLDGRSENDAEFSRDLAGLETQLVAAQLPVKPLGALQ
jgi:hypothetical protein